MLTGECTEGVMARPGLSCTGAMMKRNPIGFYYKFFFFFFLIIIYFILHMVIKYGHKSLNLNRNKNADFR